ncbi:hypothetical protein [Roseomonas sp. AR75]|uniref:hypothetical protein n=1 Tax=Roseomonas sp. AR75 TaxID=2562311 RepID=UPI0010BFDAED|nr:hypothetical protein [Roseomonas sp. AR75]
MRGIRAALAVGLLAYGPALAQPQAMAAAARALQAAESELRDTLRRMDEGSLGDSMGVSRLRQALNEVERAMLRMPAESRQGAPWQTAVKEVTEAMETLRADQVDPSAARDAAGEALGTLPALRGAETGSEGG